MYKSKVFKTSLTPRQIIFACKDNLTIKSICKILAIYNYSSGSVYHYRDKLNLHYYSDEEKEELKKYKQ